jgi:hypothetical protein
MLRAGTSCHGSNSCETSWAQVESLSLRSSAPAAITTRIAAAPKSTSSPATRRDNSSRHHRRRSRRAGDGTVVIAAARPGCTSLLSPGQSGSPGCSYAAVGSGSLTTSPQHEGFPSYMRFGFHIRCCGCAGSEVRVTAMNRSGPMIAMPMKPKGSDLQLRSRRKVETHERVLMEDPQRYAPADRIQPVDAELSDRDDDLRRLRYL